MVVPTLGIKGVPSVTALFQEIFASLGLSAVKVTSSPSQTVWSTPAFIGGAFGSTKFIFVLSTRTQSGHEDGLTEKSV